MSLHNSSHPERDQRYTKVTPPWETGQFIGAGVKPISLDEKDLKKRRMEFAEKLLERLDQAGVKGISFDDCVEGKGGVEHISAAEALGKVVKQGSPKKELKYTWDSPVGFGKHKDLTYRELRDEQEGYFDWAMENIEWFPKRIESLGHS